MTKKQYLKKLEQNIQALPVEEQKEALSYYSDYFDEADDDDKVIEELGSPEELAKTIIDKFSCVPAKSRAKKAKDETENERTEDSGDEDYYEEDEKLFFTFDKSRVKNLGLAFEACDTVIKSGSEYKVETRGISEKDFRCEINQAGSLIIENKIRFSKKFFKSHSDKKHLVPRILITIPNDACVGGLNIKLGAGQLRTKNISIKSERTLIDIGAGNFEFSKLNSDITKIRSGMGSVKIGGKFSTFCNIDCGMGSVQIKADGNPSDYSYDGKVRLGSIDFDGDKRSGFGQNFRTEKKASHFSLNCGMGEIKVSFNN